MMERLHTAYRHVVKVLGGVPECYKAVGRVERLRQYWRPSRVRLILLGESHVYTTSGELVSRLKARKEYPRDLPRGFVRHVYCPGYGENELLDDPILDPPNRGCSQFWKLLFACVCAVSSPSQFHPLLKGRSALGNRLAQKLSLLDQLRQRGVWLLDSSIVSLYRPSGEGKPNARTIQLVQQSCWDDYVERVVVQAKPEGVLCVGSGVAAALSSRLDRTTIPWEKVPQPNARLSRADHWATFQKCYKLVQNLSAYGGCP